MLFSFLRCGGFLLGLNTVTVDVLQLKTVSYFGNARLQQTLVMWTLGLFFLPQPPFWAFQKSVFRTSPSCLKENMRDWEYDSGIFFLKMCTLKSVGLISSLVTFSFWTAPGKYNSPHVLCVFLFFFHALPEEIMLLVNLQWLPASVLLQHRSTAGSTREAGRGW